METVLVERSGGVVWATMNRPEKKNALSMAMAEELIALVAEVERRSEDRVLVLTGAGGSFSSGADLTDSDTTAGLSGPAGWIERIRRIHALPLSIHRLPKPVVAAVPGVAAGAGCNLALACDLVVASSDARFCEIFVRRGLLPRLRRIVAPAPVGRPPAGQGTGLPG